MEVEAWFLFEHSHFERIHPSLTPVLIQTGLGFNPAVDDMEQRPQPAEDLHQAYKLVGLAYNNRRANALRTINALDFANVYIECVTRCKELRKLVNLLDVFFSN